MKNNSLAQQSNDVSSTKEYSNAMNTYFNQNTPSSKFPTKIKKEKNINKNLVQENIDYQKNNFKDNIPQTNSKFSKSPNNKIIFNTVKCFSAKPTKYFSDFQKSTKMRIIELNSNSKSNSSHNHKGKYIYDSLNPSLYEPKITPRVINTQNNTNSSSKRKRSGIPLNKSSKIFFSNSQGFSGFSKSFNKKYKSNKKASHSYNNLPNLNKSITSLRNSKKYFKNSGRSNSLKDYKYYLNPTNKQYIGIDLNLVSNSSHKRKGEINSQKKRYIKNYNYNNDEEENDKNENDNIDYNLKSNDNYFFPKKSKMMKKKKKMKFLLMKILLMMIIFIIL